MAGEHTPMSMTHHVRWGSPSLWLAGLSLSGLVSLAWAAVGDVTPYLVYNPTDSIAPGWYRLQPLRPPLPPLSVGSVVLVSPPVEAAMLAAQRGYLPARVPLLKPVGAMASQHVCVTAGTVRINGVVVARVLRADRLGRPLSAWPGCRRLYPGEVFLLSTTNPASFDSRYFGPVPMASVRGAAQPLLTR